MFGFYPHDKHLTGMAVGHGPVESGPGSVTVVEPVLVCAVLSPCVPGQPIIMLVITFGKTKFHQFFL